MQLFKFSGVRADPAYSYEGYILVSQNVQKLQILLFSAFCIASILNLWFKVQLIKSRGYLWEKIERQNVKYAEADL